MCGLWIGALPLMPLQSRNASVLRAPSHIVSIRINSNGMVICSYENPPPPAHSTHAGNPTRQGANRLRPARHEMTLSAQRYPEPVSS